MSYTIRKIYDEELIKLIHDRLFPQDKLSEKFNDEATHSWILFTKDGDQAGFITLLIRGKTGILTRVGVEPKHRGQKLQIKLQKHLLKYAKRIGLNCVTTYVKNSNIPSFKNLLNTGFKPYKPKKPFDEQDIIYLIKKF